MEPKISLEYNSAGGNGYLGKGWGIGGLSVITRCPSTVAVDKKVRAVHLDAQDQYCLDGQRLIKIGSNGSQTEYRTQINNYSKVIAHETDRSRYGPESWTVYTKSGLIYEYGVVESNSGTEKNYSKIIANYHDVHTKRSKSLSQSVDADQIVLSWAVSSIRDITDNGNIIEFFYNYDKKNRERYIKKITYSGGRVEFEYDKGSGTRRDTISGYLAGSRYQISKLLSLIRIYDTEDNNIETYGLEYQTNTKYTQLTKIRHLINGVEIQPLDITWSEESYKSASYQMKEQTFNSVNKIFALADWENNGSAYLASIVNENATVHTLSDINGDGFIDKVLYDVQGDKTLHVAFGGINTELKYKEIATIGKDMGFDPNFIFFIDVDNDGKSDFVAAKEGGIYISLGTGSSFPAPKKVQGLDLTNLKKSDTPIYLVDLNKDGLPDIIHFNTNFVEISYNDNGHFQPFQTVVDLGQSFTQADGWQGTNDYGEDNFPRRFADVNGDGYLDLIGFDQTGVKVAINAGNGFEAPYHASIDFGYDDNWREGLRKRIIADINNDGYADIVGFGADKTYIYYGNGKRETDKGFEYINDIDDFSTNKGWGKETYRGLYDINNDGTLDIVGFKDHKLIQYISDQRFHVVTAFNNHKDQSLTLYYSSLMVDNIYQKGSESIYGVTLTPPMLVVSNVAVHDGDSIDNEVVDEYRYSGYRVDRVRGALGFERVKKIHKTTTDPSKNIQSVTEYYQGFPYIGMVHYIYSGFALPINAPYSGEVISSTSNSMDYFNFYAKVYDVYLKTGYNSDHLTGAGTLTENSIYNDGTGNIHTSTVKTYNINNSSETYYATATTNEYADNKEVWLIGRLSKATVEYGRSDSDEVITKLSSFEYDPNSGLLTKESVEPNQEKRSIGSEPYF